jgi:hypothetical protein
MEDLAKVSKLPRGKLAVHARCIVDAAIQGAYDQWREFGRKMAHAKELRSLHPEEVQFVRIEDQDHLKEMAMKFLKTVQKLRPMWWWQMRIEESSFRMWANHLR